MAGDAHIVDRPDGQMVPPDLLAKVIAYYDPVEVILFGSQARASTGPDSDVDLMILVDDDTPKEKLSWRGLTEARRGYREPVDLLACPVSVFRARARIAGSFAHTIKAEGIVVYERR